MLLSLRNRRALPVYLFVFGYLGSSLLFYVLSRLRAPALPFLFMFAGFAVSEIYRLIHEPAKRKIGFIVLTSTAILYLFTNLIPVDRRHYSTQAWTQLGHIYLERHRAALAADALTRALRFDQHNIVARYSLILAHCNLRRIEEAKRELLKFNPQTPDALLFRYLASARIAIATRDYTAAVKNYHAALKIDPHNPETSYLLGIVFITLNKLDSAEIYLDRAVALDQFHEAARNALTIVRAKR
ncbi:MAG: tetratricopeptide repeat protein, partial [bacterium]